MIEKQIFQKDLSEGRWFKFSLLEQLGTVKSLFTNEKSHLKLLNAAPWILLAGLGHLGNFGDAMCCALWTSKAYIEYKKLAQTNNNDTATTGKQLGWAAVGLTAGLWGLAHFVVWPK